MTDLYWAIYQTPTPNRSCPERLQRRPARAVRPKLFPRGRKRTVVDTQLMLETKTWLTLA